MVLLSLLVMYNLALLISGKCKSLTVSVKTIELPLPAVLAFATENKLSSITDGVITDLTNGDMYWASKDKGAFYNEKQIKVQIQFSLPQHF